jgi:hypothetical protein
VGGYGYDSQGAYSSYPRPRRPRVDPITGLESLTDEDSDEDAATGGLPQGLVDRYLTPADTTPTDPTLGKLKDKEAPPPSPGRTVGGTLQDVGISALKGAIAIPEAAVGLADIVSGGRAGQALESVGFEPGRAKQILSEYYSPEQQAANRAVSEAKGFVGTAQAALENPSVIGQSIVESLPLMLGGAGAARAAGVLGLEALGAGALGEGLVTAGSAAEQTRQSTRGGLLSPGQAAAAAASGALTGGFGVAGGKIAKYLDIEDVDTLLAGALRPEKAKNLVKQVIYGAFSEGILEELPQSVSEQVLQNAATDRPLDEGVAQ